MGAVVWLYGYTDSRDVFLGGGSEISSEPQTWGKRDRSVAQRHLDDQQRVA
jgi:hypothetical protein